MQRAIFFLAVCCMLAAARAGVAQQPAEEPTFDILEYRVEGNSVLPKLAIERAVYPHLGEKKRIGDVEKARVALEKAYRDAGYATVVVNVPQQKVDKGVVVLQVIEGRIERVRVTGSRYYSQGSILERVGAAGPNEVPYFPEVQRQIDRLNTADRRVTPVLRPGTAPGTTELELKVSDQLPLHGSVELNNRYSPGTTQLRLTGALRYDNMFQRDHSFGVQYQTSPQDTSQVKAAVATYVIPLASGSVYGYYVNSDSSVAAVADVTVLGKGRIAGLRRMWYLPGAPGFGHSLTAGVDYKNFDQVAPNLETPVHYMPFSLDYSGNAQGKSGTTQYSLATVFSFRGVGNNADDFANARFRAQPNFFILRWDVQRNQNLPWWGLSLGMRFDGQLADQPLINNEQYFAGGLMNVRGYLESEALGDRAVHGSLELRGPNIAGDSDRLHRGRAAPGRGPAAHAAGALHALEHGHGPAGAGEPRRALAQFRRADQVHALYPGAPRADAVLRRLPLLTLKT
jgi:hemolysin activation/secretion protein